MLLCFTVIKDTRPKDIPLQNLFKSQYFYIRIICIYWCKMTNISVRIDPELKKKMDSLKHLNWSEVIRKAIKSEIQKETEMNRAKAVLLNEKIRKMAPENFNSVDLIRKFREERH